MKAVVTTSHAVLVVDGESQKVDVIHTNSGVYYGITRIEDYIVVAARNRLVGSNLDPAKENGKFINFSIKRNEIFEKTSNLQLRDIHSIDYIDGKVYCCCSFDNAISIHCGNDSEFWYPLGRPLNPPYDANHINTIIHDENYIYILAHNWGNGSEIYYFERQSLGLISSIKLGMQAHSIWFDQGCIRTLSSAEGMAIGPDGFNVKVGGFPRGHATNGSLRMFGISENIVRLKRDTSIASLLITDENYNKLHLIDLGYYGMILEIFSIDNDEYTKLLNYKH